MKFIIDSLGVAVVLYACVNTYRMLKMKEGWFILTFVLVIVPYIQCLMCYKEWVNTHSDFSRVMFSIALGLFSMLVAVERILLPLLTGRNEVEEC